MDAPLKLLADASLEAGAVEEAVAESAWTTARDRIDVAAAALQDLREAWAGLSAAERAVVGPAARQVRERLEAAERRVPRHTALVEVPAEPDPEHESEPA